MLRNQLPEKGGGWILGHTVDGTQAEYVRIPLADASLHLVPEGVDEKALVMLSDIGPTGYEVCLLRCWVSSITDARAGWCLGGKCEAGLICGGRRDWSSGKPIVTSVTEPSLTCSIRV